MVRLVIAGAVGYMVVMLPWFVRNWQTTGAILAPGGTQTMWLTTYDQLFSYGHLPSAQTFLAQGFAEILRGRWWVLITNVQTVVAVWGMIFLMPLVIVGAWTHRRAGLIQVAGLYGTFLFLALTLLFAFPGARGGLFHSGAALLPIIYPVAVLGLDQAVEWIAARRRGWQVSSAKRFFSGGLVLLAVALSSFVYYNRVLKNDAWNQADMQYRAVAGWVAEADPGAVVMINNPPAYRFHGGGLSLVVPNNGIEQVLEAARHYNVDYLILDANHPAALADIYEQTRQHPRLILIKTLGDIHIFEIK